MNLYFRVLIALLSNWFRPRISYRDVLVSRHRVWPSDVDLFGHMNNGRYLQVMDVSRSAWMLRAGVARAMLRNRWSAVIGGAVVRFRRTLKPLQTYRLETRLLSWDERWWFLQHRFIDEEGRSVAMAIARCALRDRDGWVDTKQVLRAVSPDAIPPVPPEFAVHWQASEDAMWQMGCRSVSGSADA
ncbi:MAG: thioesterase family protein [Pseudomonadota bacterium]